MIHGEPYILLKDGTRIDGETLSLLRRYLWELRDEMGKVSMDMGVQPNAPPNCFIDFARWHEEDKRKAQSDVAKLAAAESACREALDSSVPYVAAHGAFMISAEAWRQLWLLVSPGAKELDALLQKVQRGEKPTEDEIRQALSARAVLGGEGEAHECHSWTSRIVCDECGRAP